MYDQRIRCTALKIAFYFKSTGRKWMIAWGFKVLLQANLLGFFILMLFSFRNCLLFCFACWGLVLVCFCSACCGCSDNKAKTLDFWLFRFRVFYLCFQQLFFISCMMVFVVKLCQNLEASLSFSLSVIDSFLKLNHLLAHCLFLNMLYRSQFDLDPSFTISLTSLEEYDFRLFLAFDQTLGFPGEGPAPTLCSNWSCLTANIDSIATHPHVYEWDDSLILLQETRVAETNLPQVLEKASIRNNTFVTSKFLTHTRQRNGVHRIPHGGTGIIASRDCIVPFSEKDDITGLWSDIKNTTRVSAAWIQVTRKVKLLAFSFYGFPLVTADFDSIHKTNDEILQKILEIASQFGDIPILIGGDFQDEPFTYEAVKKASFAGWTDPLYSIADDSEQCRPITFSRSGLFDDVNEQISSIDGLLLNCVASAALTHIELLTGDARQHAPIRAFFAWQKIFSKGSEIVRPAAFDFSKMQTTDGKPDLQKLQQIGLELWCDKYQDITQVEDDEDAWKAINQYGIDILKTSGAVFLKGPPTRGTKPIFRQKVVCPGQTPDGSAINSSSSWYSKTHSIIAELRLRLQRPSKKTSDMLITFRLQQKVADRIKLIPWCSQWNPEVHITDSALAAIQKILQEKICSLKQKEKYARISAWRNKMKDGTCNKNVHKSVFKWVKQKQIIPSNNLIKDSEGNLLTNPNDAIDEINIRWDEIYSSNILHESPQKVLSCVWPYIQDRRRPACLPELDGPSLRKQVLSRRVDASPGLDGWRTLEAHLLPDSFYTSIAKFFIGVEKGQRSLPTALVTAKQVILDKDVASESPLQKRLITILPVFLLAYSGLRFRQLQAWQSQVLPRELFGGIKNRYMTSVATNLRLEIDDSKGSNIPILGMKLDKSKCFDKLIPSISVALFIAFGIPQSIANFFLQMYSGLRRFLTYKNWASKIYTTAANGLAQGDSFSLLSINLHMAMWAIFVKRFPIDCAVFIDDAYIWARVDRLYWLNLAIEASKLWDTLIGQTLNDKKSQIWATSADGRKKIKHAFPEMELVHVLEVLGSKVQTADARSFKWDSRKTYKIKQDIKNIGALPCNTDIHAHLVGMKITPQIAFTPHITEIPKTILHSFQDAIVSILWRNRPIWRSKMLVLGFFSLPHRCDPFIARAYSTIMEISAFLKTASIQSRQKWISFEQKPCIDPNSLFAHFLQACKCLDIVYHNDFLFSFWGCQPISLLELSRRDIKVVLRELARHKCYSIASRGARKDIVPSDGILDHATTVASREKLNQQIVNCIPLGCHFDNVLVGCNLTRDRTCASGLYDSHLCRFCGTVKESMTHLTQECDAFPDDFQKPDCPTNLGPNFANFGIVEISPEHVRNRLVVSDVSHIPCPIWKTPTGNPIHLWTDGSVNNGQSFWHTTASFATVDINGCTIFKGRVSHWTISSYTAELWAIIYTFVASEQPVVIHTDCKTIVSQIEFLLEFGHVPQIWTHLSWWNFFASILNLRKSHCDQPIQVAWCKAHQSDHLPIEFLTPKFASSIGVDFHDLFCNRKADAAAKQVLQSTNFQYGDSPPLDKIFRWHSWLSNLHLKLGDDYKPDEKRKENNQDFQVETVKHFPLPHEISTIHGVECFAHLLPKWNWYDNLDEFSWTPPSENIPCPNSLAKISSENWDAIVAWGKTLSWKISDELQTSWMELACCAYFQGLILQDIPLQPRAYSTLIQKVYSQCMKRHTNPILFPGVSQKRCKANGKSQPIGLLQGCQVYIPLQAKKFLACKLLNGLTHRASDWCFDFPVG